MLTYENWYLGCHWLWFRYPTLPRLDHLHLSGRRWRDPAPVRGGRVHLRIGAVGAPAVPHGRLQVRKLGRQWRKAMCSP